MKLFGLYNRKLEKLVMVEENCREHYELGTVSEHFYSYNVEKPVIETEKAYLEKLIEELKKNPNQHFLTTVSKEVYESALNGELEIVEWTLKV